MQRTTCLMQRVKWTAIALMACAMATSGRADFTVKVDETTQRYTVTDGGKPVLTYNFGTVPVPEGVGGIYAVARSNYIHPLYGPNGEILTEDFSKDHPHHRGIYWAWPEVTYKGQKRDLHALQGVFARPVRMHKQEGGADHAELVAENVWTWGDAEPIVREMTTICVGPVRGGLRAIDLHYTFEALVDGVTLARRGQTAYGGLNVRMSARKQQQIVKHSASAGLPWPAAWAELVGIPSGGERPVGLFILQSPVNPEYPGDWVDYPNLPWLQPTFPSKGTACLLKKGDPLSLAFRIVIRHGDGLGVLPATLFGDYAAVFPDPLKALAGWQPGQDRTVLTAIENGLRDASADERLQLEERLVSLLASSEASAPFKAWVCKQLVVAGSDACVAAVAPILKDNAAWMQAADALLSRAGDAGLAAMRRELPTLDPVRRSSLCHLLGTRRDARAVGLLASCAKNTASAVEALGRIGTVAAVEVLTAMSGDHVNDALLQAAGHLAEAGQGAAAAATYERVWQDASSRSWHRAAALHGLADLVPGKSVARITQVLTGGDRHLRNGAAAALRRLDVESLAAFKRSYVAATPAVKLTLLNVWAEQEVKAAEPEALLALADGDAVVRAAGIRALGRIGGGASVAPLLDLAASGGPAAKNVETALVRMRGDAVDAALGAAAGDADEARAAVAAVCLAARRPAGYLDTMLGILRQGRRKTTRTALTALRHDGRPEHLAALRVLLKAETAAADREGVAKAMVAICKRQDGPDECLAAVLRAEPVLGGEARCAMLSALHAIGGPVALEFVTLSSDEAAVRALVKWPDAGAAVPLLAIAKDAGAAAAVRALAAAGLVQFAKRMLPSAEQRRVLREVLPHLSADADRTALRRYIGELSLRNLALNAAVSSSRPSEGGHPPAHAVDGKKVLGSYWGCTPPPCTLTVDFGRVEQISRARMTTYWDGRRYYRYRIESSVDGREWRPAVDAGENSTPAPPEGVMHSFPPREARYVRAVMVHNSANPGLHIVELEIYAPPMEEQEETP